MSFKIKIIAGLLLLLTTLSFAKARPERVVLFDNDWLFFRAPGAGGDQPAKDEAGWKPVDLPHDWSIEDLPGTKSPFHPEALNGVSGGFTTGGVGWYRKTFTVPASQKDKCFAIQFDGVYMNAEVWLNGQHLGSWPYGYSTFWFDLTDKLRPGQEQVLKVRNEGKNSRWYSGSGIYRHVWLKVTDPVHVSHTSRAPSRPKPTGVIG
jgi:beta-galactosidase